MKRGGANALVILSASIGLTAGLVRKGEKREKRDELNGSQGT